MIQLGQIVFLFFFFNDTATTEIYTLSLHDALPISHRIPMPENILGALFHITKPYMQIALDQHVGLRDVDRKSTRLNSSHANISYAVFCLKKKNNYSNISLVLLCSPSHNRYL